MKKTHLFEEWIQEATQNSTHRDKDNLPVIGKKGKMFVELMVNDWGFMDLVKENNGIYLLKFKGKLFLNEDYHRSTLKKFKENLHLVHICTL